MLRACFTDGELAVTSREECTGVRSAALLNSVYGQHRGKERLCNIRPTAIDGGMLKNIRTKVRSEASYHCPRAIPRKGEALQHRADGDGWDEEC